jgi:hypothetical protein
LSRNDKPVVGSHHNPAVHHDPACRDWIELHLRSPADLDRLGVLVAVAMAANV